MEGDIWGKHLGAPHVSLEECANQCRAMTNCRSFSHSKSKTQCKLMDKKHQLMKNTKITCSAAELKVLVIQKPCKSINFHMTAISLSAMKSPFM